MSYNRVISNTARNLMLGDHSKIIKISPYGRNDKL